MAIDSAFGSLAGSLGGNVLGTLVVKLNADTIQLVRGMRQAENIVGGTASVFASQAKLMTGVLVGAFAAISGAAAAMTKSAINAADALSKTAQVAGQSVQTFSALAHAGNLANVSHQELAQATRFLVRWMSENQVIAGDLTEEFIKQAGIIGGIQDEAVKLQIAYERFGRSGSALLPLLNQGSDAIRKQMEEARLLGLVIDEEFGRNAEAFNDNLDRMRGVLRGVFNTVAADLIPSLIALQEQFIAWAKASQVHITAGQMLLNVWDKVVLVLKGAFLGVMAVWTAFQSLSEFIATALVIRIQVMNAAIKAVIKLFDAWWQAIKGVIDGLVSLGSTAKTVAELMTALVERQFITVLFKYKELGDGVAKGLTGISETIKGAVTKSAAITVEAVSTAVGTAVGLSAESIEAIKKQWADLTQLAVSVMAPLAITAPSALGSVPPSQGPPGKDVTSKIVRNIRGQLGPPQMLDSFTNQVLGIQMEIAAREEGLMALEELAAEELALTGRINEEKLQAIEEYNARLQQLMKAQIAIQLQAAQTAFDSMAQVAADFAGKQSGIYKAMFAASKAFALAEAIVKIQQGIANAASLPWPTNLAAIASVIAATAGIVSTIASATLEIGGKRAAGGMVSANTPFLVGERGPEIFTPAANGSITPNEMVGGGNVKVIINNYTDAHADLTEKMEGQQRVIEIMIRRVKSELGAEIRDGRGEVTRAMEQSWRLRRGQ